MLIKYDKFKQKDIDYLNFILRCGTVTAQQVYLFFEEKNMDAAYRRLRKLRDKGLIKHDKTSLKTGVYIGTKEARNVTEAKVTVPESPSLYSLRHTLLITDLIIYHELSARRAGRKFSFKSEREIRFEALQNTESGKSMVKKINEIKERIPDCIFLTETKSGQPLKYWIELELSQKDNKRYDAKFKERFEPILANGEYTQVWYFSDAERIRNAIETAKSKLLHGKSIRVSDIPQVIKEDNWEGLLLNGSRNDGKTTGEGESGPGN